MINLINICKKTLERLSNINNEIGGGYSEELMIFPQKKEKKGYVKRISEQELRLIFIEEFKEAKSDLFYSIETPTTGKYKFGKSYNELLENIGKGGISGSTDMCVFKRENSKFKRILNIEFKHTNCPLKNIGKDFLKLIKEAQNGAFVHLLDNTNKGTLCNDYKGRKGVFDKYLQCFNDLEDQWEKGDFIELVILSLKQKTLLYRKIHKYDLGNLDKIFFKNGCGNIKTIKENGWQTETLV